MDSKCPPKSKNKSGLIFAFALILLIFTLTQGGLSAQDALPDPIYSGPFPRSWSWSADSLQFAFTNGIEPIPAAVEMNDEDWFEYDVTTRLLIRHIQWPLQPTLTDAEETIFSPGATFMFASPDGRFLIYAGDRQPDELFWMKIADRQNQKASNLPDFVLSPTSGTEDFNVLWSADSASFVTSSTSENGYNIVDYTSNFQSDLSKATVEDIDGGRFHKRLFTVLKAYDVSDNGEIVLCELEEYTETVDQSNLPLKLAIWNTEKDSIAQVIDNLDGKTITGASFAAGDDSKLLVTNDSGLIEYDLSTDTSTILYPAFKGNAVIFSPDAHYAAIIADNGNVMIAPIPIS